MNITVNRTDLTKALSSVGKVIEHRQTIPILANVLLSAADCRLTVVGNDLDIEIASSIACDGGGGETTVDARRLADISKRIAGDTVNLAIKDDKLVIKDERSRFALPTLPAVDYPRLDSGVFDVVFPLDFAELVTPVKFAISNEQTRIYLNGVHLHSTDDNGIRAVATDGHRLAYNFAPNVPAIPPVIVPAKTISAVPGGVVEIGLSRNKVRFSTADTVVVSKLIDGTFPDYERVIPKSNDKTVTVDRKDFADAVARASTVSSERVRAARFSFGGDNITIDMRTDDGEAHEDVPAEYDGDPVEIGFNTSYINDVLSAMRGESIRVAVADAGTPAIFRGDGNAIALCMPMRV